MTQAGRILPLSPPTDPISPLTSAPHPRIKYRRSAPLYPSRACANLSQNFLHPKKGKQLVGKKKTRTYGIITGVRKQVVHRQYGLPRAPATQDLIRHRKRNFSDGYTGGTENPKNYFCRGHTDLYGVSFSDAFASTPVPALGHRIIRVLVQPRSQSSR